MPIALAHFVTDCARVTAFSDHIKVVSTIGRGRLTIFGQIARNLFGNQEFLLPLVTMNEVTEIVGSTPSSESEGAEGKSYQDLVIEKVTDGLYRMGYASDMEASLGIMADEKTLEAVITACRVSLFTADEHQHFGYDEDFWVVHAGVGNDSISISARIFEIITENGLKITISRDNMGEWLEIFAAADDLEAFNAHSMMSIRETISLYKADEGILHLKIVTGDRQIGITATHEFFTICHRLMGIVWLGEDIYDEDFAKIFEDDDDDDDDETYTT